MNTRTYAVHVPARSLSEAAMLPALEREPAADVRRKQGSMAGRAVLSYIKSAPAQRRRRRGLSLKSCTQLR